MDGRTRIVFFAIRADILKFDNDSGRRWLDNFKTFALPEAHVEALVATMDRVETIVVLGQNIRATFKIELALV